MSDRPAFVLDAPGDGGCWKLGASTTSAENEWFRVRGWEPFAVQPPVPSKNLPTAIYWRKPPYEG